MVTKRKLAEASYFLDELKNELEPDKFNYKLSAFLSASHSVMDIIIYDFVEMRGMGITRHDWLDGQRFELVAKSHNVPQELEFSKWMKEKNSALSRKPI